MLPAKSYPNDSSDNYSELSYSHRLLTIWTVRISYVAAIGFMLLSVTLAVNFVRAQNYLLMGEALLFFGAALFKMISSRNYVYKIEVIGDRLLLQTAFSKKEYRISELTDIYKRGNLKGASAWTIKTPDCDYKFQTKDPVARKFLDKLLSLLPSAASSRWTEFQLPDFDEKRLFLLEVYLLIGAIIGLTVAHATMIGSICLLCAAFFAFQMRLVALRVKVNERGVTIVNLLRQEKTIPWQSINSLKRTKEGAIFLNCSQGKFILSALDGSNILLNQTARNIAPNLFIDEQNSLPKLNRNKP